MIIGIDGNEANVKERVGVGQYAFDILWSIYNLAKKDKKNYRLISEACKPVRLIVYLQKKPLLDLPKEDKFLKYKIIEGGGLWVVRKLMPHLLFSKEKPDVFFTPNHYLPPILSIPSVVVIHDLKYLDFPAQFKKSTFWQLKYWTARSISISKKIIAVSNSTKKEIVRHYKKASKKVVVVPHGYDENKFNTDIKLEDVRRINNKYSIVNDYLLYVGTLKPSKNIERLIRAFAETAKDFDNLQLVVAGKKGWMYEKIYKIVTDLGISNKIIFTDYLPEEDKPVLMKGAKALVAPSLTEGFGMHALEAMACGTPVLVSKIDAFEEVVGSAGVFINPKSAVSIKNGITKILKMNDLKYNKLVMDGLARVKEFSWKKAGAETLAVLESAK